MRLPVQPLPPLPPAMELYQIRERPPVTPSRSVRARNLPPLIVPSRQKQRESVRDGREGPPAAETWLNEERRRADRQVAQEPVLRDTHSGHDRRQAIGEEGCRVDIEV